MSYLPPYFERGKIPFADRLNQMIDVLRSCIIGPGVGYTLTRTMSGQVLTILPQGGGGGGGGTTAACPFAAIDVSSGGTTKVAIKSGMVDGTWPKGMGPGLPDPEIPTPSTGYIYLVITFDENFIPLNTEDGYVFSFFEALQANDATHQYVLTSVVVVEGDAITTITNQCIQPAANPCALILPEA
jgi:hypothetical protein